MPIAPLRLSSLVLALAGAGLLVGCPDPAPSTVPEPVVQPDDSAAALPSPPIAKVVPHPLEIHGHTRIDDYYWLREREDPEVIAYLEAENAYTEAMTRSSAELRETLHAELVARLEPDDETVPYRRGDYFYYSRFRDGGDYPTYCRKRESLDAAEEVMLDAQALAGELDYFRVGELEVSEGQGLLAYSVDTVGRRIHTIHVKDLATGAVLPDTLTDVTGSLVWANDDETLFYTKQDPTTLREHQVWRHTLGQPQKSDALVYEEPDETFSVSLSKTKSRAYVVIASQQTLSSEVRLINADAPSSAPRVVQARERGLEYDVDHRGDRLYIRTNLDATNFRIVETKLGKTGKQHWRELVPHRPDVLVEGVELFTDYYVVSQRRAGLIELEVHPFGRGEPHTIAFPDPVYVAYPSRNAELDSATFRYTYESMTTPTSVYDYDLGARTQILRDQEKVLGGFDPANYVSERVWAPARDGVEVPISLVYRKDRTGPAPLLLYAYGSYGASMDADFSAARLSLLDRGFVFAIAHVRGGEDLGRGWYEQGKLFAKRNTFTDFIDCAEHLRDKGHAKADRIFAEGGSAGGLLVGAVVNMRPDLFRGAIAAVPFVDVVTTMLDDSIPLTTGEWDEWGDPHRKPDYDYMLSYSPYDNVEAKAYPALLVIAGLHDSQVQYWEPAKWVAKLRARKTDQNPLLFQIDMTAGHSGQAGRIERLEQVAFEYAFLLSLL